MALLGHRIPDPPVFCSAGHQEHIPYSGKFSLVQIFVKLPVNPSEEIFVVLIFARASAIPYNAYTYIQTFALLIFAAADLSAKNAKVCTMRKFPAIR